MLTHQCPVRAAAAEANLPRGWKQAFFVRKQILQFVREMSVNEAFYILNASATFFYDLLAGLFREGTDADFNSVGCLSCTLNSRLNL